MTPQSREKTAKTAFFRHRWQAWKVVRSIGAVRQRPRTPRNWRCSFAFFESFLWQFNKKQRAEVIFRLSRPVSCKNQENGSGKQWSLHAPLKRRKFVSARRRAVSLHPLWLSSPHWAKWPTLAHVEVPRNIHENTTALRSGLRHVSVTRSRNFSDCTTSGVKNVGYI